MTEIKPDVIELAADAILDRTLEHARYPKSGYMRGVAANIVRGYLTAALPSIRASVLEEAAKACEAVSDQWDHPLEVSQSVVAYDCASRIRSLKGEGK